ncbi:MAG TPA: helix-turn-helix domain-containing protein [Pilimelia sp.]|nr:helix-turn-helix domain-containing protein [Pilimelia sp.]
MRADARRNRQRVLDTAYAVFATDGIGVPIDEVARRAGVGAGTVYRHFPTKEALVEAVVRDRIGAMTAKARSGVDFGGFFAFMVEASLANRAVAEALAGGGYRVPADAEAALQAAFADLLRHAQRTGDVHPDITPDDLNSLVVGCVATARQRGDTALVRIVLAGLRP